MKFPEVHKTRLSVVSKQYLTPNYLSIVFHTDDAHRYAHTTLGSNNKIFIPPIGQKTFELPDFDFATMKWLVQDESQRPIVRTYTHRHLDLANNTMTIDFAMHGTESPACHWASEAGVGDELGVVMVTETVPIVPNADHYLFICDTSGLPATIALLAQLPTTATAHVIAEVLTPEDEQPLFSTVRTTVQWLHNPHPNRGSQITAAVKNYIAGADIKGSRFAHIAAEHASVRASRNFLRKEQGWAREECYACAYWQIGRREGESKTLPLMDD